MRNEEIRKGSRGSRGSRGSSQLLSSPHFGVLWVAAPVGIYIFLISASKLRCLEPKSLYYLSLELVLNWFGTVR